MKHRFLALLLALSLAFSVLSLPAAAAGTNAALQTAVTLGALTADQAAGSSGILTRGQLAQMLAAYSPYRSTLTAQSGTGKLFTDLAADAACAPAVRVAVNSGWMSGYSDGSFRPDEGVTLEAACSAVLSLLGYDLTTLGGDLASGLIAKAGALGLTAGLSAGAGQTLTLAEGSQLLYNALTAQTSEGQVYASTLGFTVTDGVVDAASVLLSGAKGPFVAKGNESLPFAPAAVYRNGEASDSAQLSAYDVYYYSESARTLWIYNRRAAGRITAVSPSAGAPTSVTVAGVSYTLASSEAAYQISALSGGGVGQVVTLLLGMEDEVVAVLTGEEADQVFYGVVQTASRSLVETNGADVQQAVTVLCTDGQTRTVSADKALNFPAGWLVEIRVSPEGETVEALAGRSISGQVNAEGTALGELAFAPEVEILDTTSEGVAGTIRPSRLSGVTLSDSDVRYYTLDENGAIDRLILDDVTGDLWEYATLDDVRQLTEFVGEQIDQALGSDSGSAGGQSASAGTALASLLPSTSDLLYSAVDGSLLSTLWNTLSSGVGTAASALLQLAADNTSGALSSLLGFFGSGANYVCWRNGEQVSYQTSVKYPVAAGGIAVSKSTTGTVRAMVQLMPVVIDQLGAASVTSGGKRYETADDMQVYLWYSGQYYATTLSQLNTEDYTLIGWYDNFGCAAGGRIRVLVAVKKS